MISIIFILAGFSYATSSSAAREGDHRNNNSLELSEFQSILSRTGLDDELVKFAQDRSYIHQNYAEDQRHMHKKKRSNVRRRTTNNQDLHYISSVSEEHVWDNLLKHAWNLASSVKRDNGHSLSITTNPQETYPSPFLICHHHHHYSHLQDTLDLFDAQYEDSLVLSSSHERSCLILTTTAYQVDEVTNSNPTLEATPLLDISKINAGTIDEISSQGWTIPFHEHGGERDSASERKNETESMNDWERMITVDFVPGLGGMKEESELLETVNDMMSDILDMVEVGWLRSIGMTESSQYRIDESLDGVPALSDMFSLTSSTFNGANTNDNSRVKFWKDSFREGLETEHACSEMFSTLFVKPRAGYYSYDLVLNPQDGPPPKEYESSASNSACVVSLIAALSTHPYVLSVKAGNVPIYQGWNIISKLKT